MVWVDNSLFFASSDETMDHVKDTLCSEWEVTDLGEPSKIVGIEVMCSDDIIMISQEKYTENVLWKEGMVNANPVGVQWIYTSNSNPIQMKMNLIAAILLLDCWGVYNSLQTKGLYTPPHVYMEFTGSLHRL